MAFSGSVEGRSGSVMRPAPSILRLVRDDEWLVRREPFPARVIGDDPVPVVTWLDVREDTGADTGMERTARGAVIDRAFASACPQTSQ